MHANNRNDIETLEQVIDAAEHDARTLIDAFAEFRAPQDEVRTFLRKYADRSSNSFVR